MERSNYHISLDIQDSHSGVLLNMKQHDTHRRICITLTDGGRPYALREGCYGVFTAKKPEGAAIFNDCAIEGDTLVYDVTRQTTAEVGELACEVRLYGGDDKLLTCAAFGILVCPAVVSDDDDIASMPEATTLSRLLDRVEKVEDFMDDTTVSDKAWSAKKLIDTLCPPFSQTGSVVTCHPVALYPLTVISESESLWHGSKNLVDDVAFFTERGFTLQEDGRWFGRSKKMFTLFDNTSGANGRFTFSMDIERVEDVNSIAIAVAYTDGTNSYYYPGNQSGSRYTVTTAEGKVVETITWSYAKSGTFYIKDMQLEYGDTATEYAPYRGETVEPGEVCAYAGKNTFIAESGQLTVTGRRDITAILEGMENGN